MATLRIVLCQAAIVAAALIVPLPGYSQTGIPGIVAAVVEPELVKEGFQFTEGPLGTPDGGIYFTDLRANRIYRIDAKGSMAIYREQTNGANGLVLTADGGLLAAQGDGKKIVKFAPDGRVAVVVEVSQNGPFLAPNDLITDRNGGLYFTDPGPRPVVPGRKAYVYYLRAGTKQPVMLDDAIARPNGITLTEDGKTLIVDDTLNETIYAFDLQRDGTVKGKRPFARLRDIPAGQESGADGMALDREGHLYVTSVAGVQVFDRKGQYLGTIKVPRQATNVAFAGPDKRVLYITAREGLYRMKMLSQGPRRRGK